MKKILATILALTMVLSLGAIAFAADGALAGDYTEASGSASSDVSIKVDPEKKTENYKVDIDWATLTYTYDLGTKKWNTGSHEWQEEEAAGWSGGDPTTTFTVTNHSSQKVNVKFQYTAESGTIGGATGWDSVTVTYAQGTGNGGKVDGSGNVQLKSADSNPGSTGAAQSVQVQVHYNSLPTPTEEVSVATKIGSFTATVETGTYSD